MRPSRAVPERRQSARARLRLPWYAGGVLNAFGRTLITETMADATQGERTQGARQLATMLNVSVSTVYRHARTIRGRGRKHAGTRAGSAALDRVLTDAETRLQRAHGSGEHVEDAFLGLEMARAAA